jgi:hypothetical protein
MEEKVCKKKKTNQSKTHLFSFSLGMIEKCLEMIYQICVLVSLKIKNKKYYTFTERIISVF